MKITADAWCSFVQRYGILWDVPLTPACINEASSQSLTGEDPESLHRALYVARSHLATRPVNSSAAKSVLEPYAASSPAAKAVLALADYLSGGETSSAKVDEVRDLVLEFEGGEEEGEDTQRAAEESVVRVVAGTMFVLEDEVEEAVATLTEGSAKSDLEWYVWLIATVMLTCSIALLVQLLLSLDRKDLAQTTYQTAKKIGNDSTLVQAIEAWIGMKTVRSCITT